jgi:acetylornithine/succinyldiaminopimelate/putrescine aminotransferase
MQQPYETRDAAFAAFGRHVNRGKTSTYRALGLDVVMGRREGPFFWDAYGTQRFWNCHCNGGTFNLGHRHPRVVDAVRRALDDGLDIGNHHLVSGMRARLAERLAATTGGALPGVVFGACGGEAVDLAIKVARGVTGRRGVVSAKGGYHGHTGLALAAGDDEYRAPFGPNLPGFVQVAWDDLDALDRAVGDDTAAVLLETIPATLGMPLPSPGYLEGVARVCRERGARLLLDEVQTGLGRTGKVWGFQHHDLAPDAVITAKGLSGGLVPIAATLLAPELHAFFDDRPFIHISTFGGAELACAAALAVLDLVTDPALLARVEALGARFRDGLAGLPFTLRQRGLMMGFAFPAARAGMLAAKLLYDRGVFAAWAANDTSVLQFLPPLILDDDQAAELCATVRAAFA